MVLVRNIFFSAFFFCSIMHATIARVNQASHANSSANVTVSQAYSPITGNTIFVVCNPWGSSGLPPATVVISDGGTNTYNLVAGTNDLSRMTQYLFRGSNVTGGSFTYSCTVTGSGNWFISITVIEYSGLRNTLVLDKVAYGTGKGSPLSSDGFTTTNANDLLLILYGASDNSGDPTITTPSGWSVVSAFDANTSGVAGVMDQVVSSIGTYSPTVVRNPASTFNWEMMMFSFRDSASPAPVTTGIIRLGNTKAYGQSGSTTISQIYASTPGNSVFVVCASYASFGGNPTTQTVDNGGVDTFVLDTSKYDENKSAVYIFRNSSVTGGLNKYTCTIGSSMFQNMFIIEYSGLTGVTDGIKSNSGTCSVSTPIDAGRMTTTNAADLILAPWADSDNNGDPSFTAANGWTMLDATSGTLTSLAGIMEKNVSSIGEYDPSVSISRSPTANFPYAILQVAYKGSLALSTTRSTVTIR